MEYEYGISVVLVSLGLLFFLAYGLRVALKGRAQFARVDRTSPSIFLNKPAMEVAHWTAEPLAKVVRFLKITPNQISWAALVFGAVAAYFLARGRFGIGAALSVLAALFDMLDGMVARLTGVASDAGEVLDAAIDRYVEFLFLGGLLVYYRSFVALQILTLLTILGSFMVSYSTAKAEAMNVIPPPCSMRRPERAIYLILGAALTPLTLPYEVLHGIPPIGIPMVISLILVGGVSNISAALRFWQTAKSIRARGN
jgi:CDP-diacylglycerol---glycerol-3-phosphate 3-phosphatidyltransferase